MLVRIIQVGTRRSADHVLKKFFRLRKIFLRSPVVSHLHAGAVVNIHLGFRRHRCWIEISWKSGMDPVASRDLTITNDDDTNAVGFTNPRLGLSASYKGLPSGLPTE